MIIGKSSIQNKIANNNLISNSESNHIKNCSYKVRIGKLIRPETGEVINLQSVDSFCLEPSEIILFESIEEVKLPYNITASYSALYSVASEGILLINSSMIEPGYSGLLSGVLLNFSSNKFVITKNFEIAKLNFYQTDEENQEVCSLQTINNEDYQSDLIKKAIKKYHKTFLNISGLENRVISKTLKSVKRSIVGGGILIGFLILFASLEPLFSRWMWELTGLPTKSEQVEIEKNLLEIKNWQEKNSELKKMQNQIDSLKKDIILLLRIMITGYGKNFGIQMNIHILKNGAILYLQEKGWI
mgnify:CR=1 FL=1